MIMIAVVVSGCGEQQPKTVALEVGAHAIAAEVARTESQQALGLMNRTTLADGYGMLFVFKRPVAVCMWMRDTLIPLTAAFLEADGTIVTVADMEPRTDTQHCATRPVSFVLEVPKGFLASRGIDLAPGIRTP